jgi:hypothetical protein
MGPVPVWEAWPKSKIGLNYFPIASDLKTKQKTQEQAV